MVVLWLPFWLTTTLPRSRDACPKVINDGGGGVHVFSSNDNDVPFGVTELPVFATTISTRPSWLKSSSAAEMGFAPTTVVLGLEKPPAPSPLRMVTELLL